MSVARIMALACAFTCAVVGTASADSIGLTTPGQMVVTGIGPTEHLDITALPFTRSLRTMGGDATFSATLDASHLEFDGTYLPVSPPDSGHGFLGFTVSTPETYKFTGGVTSTGPTSTFSLELSLMDQTTGETLFSNSQHFSSGQDVSLVVGGEEGQTHSLSGSLTGILMPGHTYAYNLNEFVTRGGSGTVRAEGAVTLTATAVPLPAGALPAAVLLGVLGVTQHRRFAPG